MNGQEADGDGEVDEELTFDRIQDTVDSPSTVSAFGFCGL